MLPTPKQVQYKTGIVSSDAMAEEKIVLGMKKEQYHILVSQDKILLEGGSQTGLFYARTTLEQLRMLHGKEFPCVEIMDEPAYPFRSFHIDCARHFFGVNELKKMIRMAAEFKLNRFHWHISDDQGWRIESRRYPRLHEIGSVREGDHFGNYASDAAEGQFYTREEVQEIVAYCEEYGIEVIPEIDMPGHVTAILAAYPRLSCTENAVKVGTKAGIFKDTLCPGKEETFAFIESLLDDLLELFPGKYIHIGGDEAPKERWNSCPYCQKRMQEEGLADGRQLQGYFENRVAAYLKERGRIPIVWNEAAYGGNLNSDVVVQVWTEDKDYKIKSHLTAGGKVIVSNMMNSYCDYPYGFISLKSVYDLNTVPDEWRENKQSVMGTECLVWTEYVRDAARLEELCWPRFAASAQVGWCGEKRPDYEEFAKELAALFPLFEKYGMNATKQKGWVPDQKMAEEQIAEFRLNFIQENVDEFRKAQEDV